MIKRRVKKNLSIAWIFLSFNFLRLILIFPYSPCQSRSVIDAKISAAAIRLFKMQTELYLSEKQIIPSNNCAMPAKNMAKKILSHKTSLNNLSVPRFIFSDNFTNIHLLLLIDEVKTEK